MKIAKGALQLAAALAVLIGVIWVGQGTGVFPYPAASFMIDDNTWAIRGGALAALGLAALLFLRRK